MGRRYRRKFSPSKFFKTLPPAPMLLLASMHFTDARIPRTALSGRSSRLPIAGKGLSLASKLARTSLAVDRPLFLRRGFEPFVAVLDLLGEHDPLRRQFWPHRLHALVDESLGDTKAFGRAFAVSDT